MYISFVILFLLYLCLNYSAFNMEKTTMIVTSPFWISNMNSLIVNLLCGDRRVICKAFDERTVMKIVQDYKVYYFLIHYIFMV